MPEPGAIGNRSIILRNADSKGRALSPGRAHAPPHWLQAAPPLTTKLSFPAQIRRCQVHNFATRVKNANHRETAMIRGRSDSTSGSLAICKSIGTTPSTERMKLSSFASTIATPSA